jgi:hypothetical protein
LQACDSEASIRHAIIALGALANLSQAAVADASRSTCGTRPVQYYQYALLQYGKAIEHMRAAVSSNFPKPRTTLLCCFLIIIFEAGLGNDKLVVDQIHNGISVLHNWRAQYADANKHVLGFSSPAPKIIEDDLVRAFSRLEIQTLYILDGRFLGPKACLSEGGNFAQQIGDEDYLGIATITVQGMPRVFNTFAQARKYLDLIMKCAIILHRMNIMVYRRTNRPIYLQFPDLAKIQHPTNIADSPTNGARHPDSLVLLRQRLAAYQAEHVSGLAQWCKCFEDYSKGLFGDGRVRPPDAETLHLYSKMVHIELATALSFSQAVFDDFTSEFGDIVALSQTLLETNHIHQGATMYFSFDLGIVLPLWVVGIKCRVKAIRRRVLSLLCSHHRKEGIWHSKLATKMIEWVMKIEEEHAQGDTIPVWARTLGILWSFDVGLRAVNLTCQHKRSELSDELVTEQTKIIW